jgi:hypothetical protein
MSLNEHEGEPMSQGHDASARTVDQVVDHAVRELDLEAKVELLTGAAAFSLHGNDVIGLRPMIFSDGPTGVRGSEASVARKSLCSRTRRCSPRPFTNVCATTADGDRRRASATNVLHSGSSISSSALVASGHRATLERLF